MSPAEPPAANIDPSVVAGFGDEWTRFDQRALGEDERKRIFDAYFSVFPWSSLGADASGFDLGCGSGRWAALVAPRVGTLYCIDASRAALSVAEKNLAGMSNAQFVHASVDAIPLPDASMDFGYSLGVLHHVPDTAAGIAAAARKLKPGAPLLLYLYYAFDNRPAWFRAIWRLSEVGRFVISRAPHGLRYTLSQLVAALVYWPLSRAARLGARMGMEVQHWPLNDYRDRSYYVLRTDALDRFGTRLEQRFTRPQIEKMTLAAGLRDIRFGDEAPYWVAVGTRT